MPAETRRRREGTDQARVRAWPRARFRRSLVHDSLPEKLDEAVGIVHAAIEAQGEVVNRDKDVNARLGGHLTFARKRLTVSARRV